MPARRALATLAVAALAAGAGACGNPVEGKSEEDRVRDVVNDFVDAGNDRDFAKVCELLTDQRRELQGGKKCVKGFEDQARGSKRVKISVKIVDVRISGAQAAVDTKLSSGKGPPSQQQLVLQKQRGEWRIATAN